MKGVLIMENSAISNQNSSFILKVMDTAMSIPGVKVNREDFLRKELNRKFNPKEIEDAINLGTAIAGLPKSTLDKIAKDLIKSKCLLTTAISFGTGLPGGALGLVGGTAADISQILANFLNLTQKLMYLYGYKDINELSCSQTDIMIVMLCAASGVETAEAFVAKELPVILEKLLSKNVEKEVSSNIIKRTANKVLSLLGKKAAVNAGTETTGKTIGKFIPLFGGILSGAMTYASFRPMAAKLKNILSANYDVFKEIYEEEKYNSLIN